MDNRVLTVVMAMLLILPCAALVTAYTSDADSSVRMSSEDIYYAQFDINFQPYDAWRSGSCLYFIDGSDNDRMMEAYLKDQSVNVTSDDFSYIQEHGYDGIVNVYEMRTYDNGYIYWSGYEMDSTKVLDRYGEITFFVKAGDQLNVNLISCVDNAGNTRELCYIDSNYNYYYLNNQTPTLTIDAGTSMEVSFTCTSTCLYVDVAYTASGYSTPNGSATAYIVICAIITVLVLAVLIYAGMKPKWSK